MRLLLFDIDGTLLLTGGAGTRAMTRAFADMHGLSDALRTIEVAGRTDRLIMRDALAQAGRAFEEDGLDAFRSLYCGYLAEEIEKPGTGHRGLLPGVWDLVAALQGRDDVELALLTGNFQRAAQIKLARFDLWQPFSWGVFGEEAFDREHLMPIAYERFRQAHGSAIEPGETIVIGDTPNDIRCARHGDARVVAVATGHYSRDSLAAGRPDALFDDFTDTAAVVRALLD
jgi:phosphoglycolate phosphatase-like HAD superfamily hydrolase